MNKIKLTQLIQPVVCVVTLFLFFSCEPLVTTFDEKEEGNILEKKVKTTAVIPDVKIRVMTWNIRFGIGRGPWFGDSCGDKVIYSEEEVDSCLNMIMHRIIQEKPDILLLQEVDILAKRSAYTDQVQWLLDNTYFNYAAYGSQWKTQLIPSDGLGRLEEVNLVLSRWPITESTRTQLSLRKDQMAIEQYFYERCCMLTAKVEIPSFQPLYVVNLHASAFATDKTKQEHLWAFRHEMERLNELNYQFVGGGDLNEIPPGSSKTDYCMENKCEDEVFHDPNVEPYHREGANFEPEKHWLDSIYLQFQPVIPLDVYQANQEDYFTATSRPDHFWERTLDYLFTNSQWDTSQSKVHQTFIKESDHCPVSGLLYLKK